MADKRASSIEYPRWVQEALVQVVRRALDLVVREGLPGEHHYYITFASTSPGVMLAKALLERYPEEMTVVIQHDYRDLDVDDRGFAVTLRFSGVPYRLVVPYTSIRAFYDPSVQFGLRFDAELFDIPEKAPEISHPAGENVVSFDRFKKR
jgi:hypothetical protein